MPDPRNFRKNKYARGGGSELRMGPTDGSVVGSVAGDCIPFVPGTVAAIVVQRSAKHEDGLE